LNQNNASQVTIDTLNTFLLATKEGFKKDSSNILADVGQKNKSIEPPITKDTTIGTIGTRQNLRDTAAIIAKVDSAKIRLDNFEQELIQLNETRQLTEPIIKKSPKLVVEQVNLGVYGSLSDLLPHQSTINLGKWWGISADFGLHSKFRITTDISHINTHYKVFEYPKMSEPLNIPQQPFSNRDYALKYIEGNIRSWQLGINGNYFFAPKKRLKPYLTTGYIYRIVVPREAEFEYLNKVTNEEKSFKVKNEDNHIDHWWRIGMGVEGTVYHSIGARISANYIQDFDKEDNTRLKYWALNAGLFFRIR
jgi:hypothetical protein